MISKSFAMVLHSNHVNWNDENGEFNFWSVLVEKFLASRSNQRNNRYSNIAHEFPLSKHLHSTDCQTLPICQRRTWFHSHLTITASPIQPLPFFVYYFGSLLVSRSDAWSHVFYQQIQLIELDKITNPSFPRNREKNCQKPSFHWASPQNSVHVGEEIQCMHACVPATGLTCSHQSWSWRRRRVVFIGMKSFELIALTAIKVQGIEEVQYQSFLGFSSYNVRTEQYVHTSYIVQVDFFFWSWSWFSEGFYKHLSPFTDLKRWWSNIMAS